MVQKKYTYILGLIAFSCIVFAGSFELADAQTAGPGDVSQDGCVNQMDLDYIRTEWRRAVPPAGGYDYDINSDNKVDAKDLGYIARPPFDVTCIPENVPINPSGMFPLKMTHAGVTRYYQVYVPIGYANNPTAYPLVMAFHGGTSDSTAQASLSLMNTNAQKNRYFVVYPDGVNNQWNDGRPHVINITNNADDVGFAEQMINKLDEQLNINRAKMYATGISNGGMMAFRIACERPSLFAAIAPVATAFTTQLNSSCNPTLGTSVAYFQGTADKEILWAGGPISCPFANPATCGSSWEMGYTISADATKNFWVSENGCNTTPVDTQLANAETPDTTQVTKSAYSGCANGAEVHFYTVTNGGHTWPGGIPFPPLGPTSGDVKATDTMWEFFVTKSR